ncbi:MAG: bifunctional 5,10-methylenetetrahydrofolate dehydrogenase/5,10-methenyltetrahydrofolate cyclohydrolase [Saccharofermentans sp.]|nr:bifunctional 5,10-methylenetetrahydrofolate dehydrogenase/5,10-methenyltetrahydrofolate cyclohydrolase [Saccharofermentans sp.]
MLRLAGKEVSDKILSDLKEQIDSLTNIGHTPTLGVLRVGAREDDLSYERGLKKKFEQAGAGFKVTELAGGCTQEELDRAFDELNRDSDIHGILVFRPLPKHLSDAYIIDTIDPGKDSDFMDIRNMSGVLAGKKDAPAPCTAEAVMEIIHHYGIETKGKKAVVLGRSLVIGKPCAMLLITDNATVTVCHTKTQDIKAECRNADIIVACCGVAKMVTEDYLSDGQVIIDVGMNVDEEGKLCGDVDYEAASARASAVTPVPGGVGTVTTAVLLRHVVRNCMNMHGPANERK